jgi:hypothetical protein
VSPYYDTMLSHRSDRDTVAVSLDPRLVWNYGTMAVLSGIGGVLFWFTFRQLDGEDAALDNLGEGHFFVTE